MASELIWGKGKHLKSFWEKISGKGVNNTNSTENGKKYLDRIDDIKENFSKIFGKDFTKDEANELALKYKEIFETEDSVNFFEKIFAQIQKDYNLPNVGGIFEEMEPGEFAGWNMFTGLSYNLKQTKRNAEGKIVEILNKHKMVNYITHELKHATQDKLANQVDIHKNIRARIDCEQKHNTELWQENLRKYGTNIEETKEKMADEWYEWVLPSFKNLEKIPEDSPLYQKGLEYIEGHRNYIRHQDDVNGYRNQLVEKEAFDAGYRMEEIYHWLTNK